MRHHAKDADEDEGKGSVVQRGRRNPHAQGDRSDQIERAEDRRRDPAQRDELDDAEHQGVIEETGDAMGIHRDGAKSECERDVSRREIKHREQAGRQLSARWRRASHVSVGRL